MRPSRGSPHGHIWAAEDTQNLAWPGPASTPALALLPTVKGTLWGQKATHCVRGDKGAGDRGAGRLGGHNNSTRHLLPVQRGRARGEGSLEFPPCALGAFQNPGASTPQLYRRCKGRFRTQPGSADWVRGQASVLRPKKHASSYPITSLAKLSRELALCQALLEAGCRGSLGSPPAGTQLPAWAIAGRRRLRAWLTSRAGSLPPSSHCLLLLNPSLRTRGGRDFCTPTPKAQTHPCKEPPEEDMQPLHAACTSRSPPPPFLLHGLSRGF